MKKDWATYYIEGMLKIDAIKFEIRKFFKQKLVSVSFDDRYEHCLMVSLTVKDVEDKKRDYSFPIHYSNMDGWKTSLEKIKNSIGRSFSENKRHRMKQVNTPTSDFDMNKLSKYKLPDIKRAIKNKENIFKD